MAAKKQNTEQTAGQIDPSVTDNPDSVVAREAGLTEGDVKALRDDANLNASAGHMANIDVWAASPAGKADAEAEKDRVKAEKDALKQYQEQVNDEGLSPAVVKYQEVVGKAAE
jgi:hypothetical protein